MDYLGKRVVVMGLGRFGGGVGATRYLAHHASRVLVTDLLPTSQLHESLDKLTDLSVEYCLGQHRIKDFTEADLIVVNPAVDRRNNRFLRAASAAGVKLTSEIQLTAHLLPNQSKTIAITGTAGKSTVTAMIGHILTQSLGSQCVYIGGNLGGSLLDHLAEMTSDSWVVMELSSFMLEDLNEDHWSPHIAVITNLAANHLDRHLNVQAYAAAKQVILEYQGSEDHAILGPDLDGSFYPRARHVHRVTQGLDPALPLAIPGKHNQLNAAMAIQAANCAGIDRLQAMKTLEGFLGLPHRMQFVGKTRKVHYYNDSKATTPEAAQLAITCFEPTPSGRQVHLIAGGYDKGTDLVPFGQFASEHCRGIYTIGATGDAIANTATCNRAKVVRCNTLERAVEQASHDAEESGGVVLLSPGCASWDQFENFEQRGAAFTALCLKYTHHK